MIKKPRVLLVLCAATNLACPEGDVVATTAPNASDPSSGAVTEASGVPTTIVEPTSTTSGTTAATDETGAPDSGLVVVVSPASPRSGSSTQLTATLDGEPAAVTWALVDGPDTAELTPAGVLSLPMTAGTWTVRATLKSDPQTSDEAVVVADFRGGLPVAGWGNGRDGLWRYDETFDDDQGVDLFADATHVFALIRHTTPPRAVLVSLDEATGASQPGFAPSGFRDLVAPGPTQIDPRNLGVAPDRVYVSGGIVLDSVLTVADRKNGLTSDVFGLYDPGERFGFPTADPTGVYIGIENPSGTGAARRLLAHGALDKNWGVGGTTQLVIPAAWSSTWDPIKGSLVLRDIEVDDSGRMLALFTSFDLNNTGRVGVLFCLDAAGDLDPAFGTGGAVVWGLKGEAGTDPSRMARAADGDIIVVGSHFGSWFARRFTADGDPVAGWGKSSYVTHAYKRNISMAEETAGVDVAILPGGYTVFLANIDPGADTTGIVRFTPEGEVDLDFGDPEADGDGWSMIYETGPVRIAAGADGRVFALGRYVKLGDMVVARDVWLNALHSY